MNDKTYSKSKSEIINEKKNWLACKQNNYLNKSKQNSGQEESVIFAHYFTKHAKLCLIKRLIFRMRKQ